MAILHQNGMRSPFDLDAVGGPLPFPVHESAVFNHAVAASDQVNGRTAPSLDVQVPQDEVLDTRHFQGVDISLRSDVLDAYVLKDNMVRRPIHPASVINIDSIPGKSAKNDIAELNVRTAAYLEPLTSPPSLENRGIRSVRPSDADWSFGPAMQVLDEKTPAVVSGHDFNDRTSRCGIERLPQFGEGPNFTGFSKDRGAMKQAEDHSYSESRRYAQPCGKSFHIQFARGLCGLMV
jgi:hypothetical protein